MKIAAVIIAGGRAERMGGREKLFLEIRGKTILQRITTILGPQADQLAINASGDSSRFAELGFPLIPDVERKVGTPLAGLHAALLWVEAHGFDRLLTVPSDTPFLPADLVSKLKAQNAMAAVAASLAQTHYLTGLWSPSLAKSLDQAINRRELRVQDWARAVNAPTVEWPVAAYDPFMNINTPENLAEAERLAAEFGL